MSVCIKAGVLLVIVVPILFVSMGYAEERDGELSGEHDQVKPQLSAPDAGEPDRGKAGADKDRPTLKLPDVVVKGDRQYRVTAERRDLLMMDPMLGTKEVPDDLGKVSVPGLDEDKDAPAADTVTAKNYLFLMEAGGGTSRMGEGKIIGGYESGNLTAILRADYYGGDHPEAFGIRPFDQGGNADLEIGVDALSGLKFIVGGTGKAETHRQPETRMQGWGDWLEQTYGSGRLFAEIEINPHSNILLKSQMGSFYEQGIATDKRPVLRNRFGEIGAEYEQDIRGLLEEDVNLLVKLDVISQETVMESELQSWQETEYLQHISVRLRFRPVTALHLDAGVRMDDFQGIQPKSASKIIGKASLVLPVGATLYATADGGLEWPLTQQWAFEHPRQAICGLPDAQEVSGEYRAGWRQRFSDQISTDIAWFRKISTDVPVWLDGDGDGLFARVDLPDGLQEGIDAKLEMQYSRSISQMVYYTYQECSVAGGLPMPNMPEHQGGFEFRFVWADLNLAFTYTFLGERYADPAETEPSLHAAHLAGMNADYQLNENWSAYLKMENMLNYTWEEWKGYAGRTFNMLAGLRVKF